MPYFLFVLGLALLVVGANFFVEHSIRIARFFRVNLAMFGAVVVAIGTSLPELGVTIDAGVRKIPDIIVGNIIGSNIANIGLILGAVMIVAAVKISHEKLHREAELMLVMSLIFPALLLLDIFNWVFGLLFLLISGFLFLDVVKKEETPPYESVPRPTIHAPLSILILVGALAAVLYGSVLTVNSAQDIANILAVPVGVVAATLIAVGTSLPELAVTAAALRKKETGLAVGNIIGSSLFNITLIGGVGGLFGKLEGELSPIYGVFFVLFAAIGYLFAKGIVQPNKLYGAGLLGLYAVYLVSLYVTS